ncbi:MAG TPA: hypothetical protein ENN54_04730 [Thermoplasmatales archaeon]|nr:hypothetical protein [Candidatus Thermoplasmatota archaeon]MDD5778812.1 hypothetical protein [Candidatus Thermoplasmatota archaeon]HDS59581.1 hypothetical protein [Thermoplasmatales archaeon]
MAMWKKISSWMFILGIVIALVAGLIFGAVADGRIDPVDDDVRGGIEVILGILGFVAGVLVLMGRGTITEKEMPMFMMATIILIALSAVTSLQNVKWFGPYLAHIIYALGIFIAPLAGLIAIKAIWDVGKD